MAIILLSRSYRSVSILVYILYIVWFSIAITSLLYNILWCIYSIIFLLLISLLHWWLCCLFTIRVSVENTSLIIHCSLLLYIIIYILLLVSSYTIYSITIRLSYTLYISWVIILLLVLIYSLYILCSVSNTIIIDNRLSWLQSYSSSSIHYLILY